MKIKGKYVYLKSIGLDDAFFIYKLRQNKFISYYLHTPPKTINEQKNWIKNNLKDKKSRDFIILNKSNKKIGTIALDNIISQNAEWGRWISTGNTYENIEAIILLLNYGFKKLNLKNIFSLTNVNNKKVVNFHKKTPAKFLGIKKSIFFIKNRNTDGVKYSFDKKRFIIFKKNFKFMTRSIQL